MRTTSKSVSNILVCCETYPFCEHVQLGSATRPWAVKTIMGFAGGHGDKSKARVTLEITTESNTLEEIRAMVEKVPAMLQYVESMNRRNEALLGAAPNLLHELQSMVDFCSILQGRSDVSESVKQGAKSHQKPAMQAILRAMAA